MVPSKCLGGRCRVSLNGERLWWQLPCKTQYEQPGRFHIISEVSSKHNSFLQFNISPQTHLVFLFGKQIFSKAHFILLVILLSNENSIFLTSYYICWSIIFTFKKKKKINSLTLIISVSQPITVFLRWQDKKILQF